MKKLLRRGAAVALAGAVAGAGLLTATPAPEASAAVGWVGLDDVSQVMLPASRFDLTGRLANKTPRKVVLRARSGGSERTLATAWSKADGTFRFSGLGLGATTSVRAVTPKQTVTVASGPKARARHRKAVRSLATAQKRLVRVKKLHRKGLTHAGKVREARHHLRVARRAVARTEAGLTRRVTVKRSESKWKSVTVVAKQSVRVAALPPVAQPGGSAATPAGGSVVSAGFVPARAGRAVTLEKQVDGAWVTAGAGVQDRSGHGVFTVTDTATYRVRTAATAEAEAVTSSAVTTKTWTPEFEDTFTGTALDASNWKAQVRSRGTGFRSCARTDASSHRVSGGVLRLGVSKDPTMGTKKCSYTDVDGVKHQLPYMRNTQLATEGRYDFRYGFAAARVKTQAAVGMHSAFWMNPNQAAVPGRPDLGTEVDVFEYFGNRSTENGVAAFVHVLGTDGVTRKDGDEFDSTVLMKGTKRWSEEFHVFSVEWTPTQYVFRVDGREFHRTTRNVTHVDQHLVLSNLTSSYELVDLKNFGDVAQVDWVRVWR